MDIELIALLGLVLLVSGVRAAENDCYRVERLNGGEPIITRAMFEEADIGWQGRNINGPSVIRVPDWLRPRLLDTPAAEANYLLYFGNHGGNYIRMAHARSIEGPYRFYCTRRDVPKGERGVLDLGPTDEIMIGNGLSVHQHIASPQVRLDHEQKRVVMYFHGRIKGHEGVEVKGNNQKTLVAVSENGLNFREGIKPVVVGFAYYDPFEVGGQLYAAASRGSLYKARDPENPFSPPANWDYGKELWLAEGTHPSDNPFQHDIDEAKTAGELPEHVRRGRHFTVHVDGDRIEFFYTRVGDAPERILMSVVDADGDGEVDPFTEWDPSFPPCEILAPERAWEGTGHPVKPSRASAGTGVRQLRDPHVFEDADGSLYIFYTGAGEEAIGVARLRQARNQTSGPQK
jgi:hypothetical protein